MSEAFALRWKLDRPFLEANTPSDVYALLTIEPNTSVLGNVTPTPAATIPTHSILLVDVSESMDVLVRRDPNAQKVGSTSAEGRAAQRVVSDVPSRREMACDVVQKMVERLQGDDLLTLIAFDDAPYVLAQAVSPNDMDTVWNAIQKLSTVGGGGTAMGKAFDSVRDLLLLVLPCNEGNPAALLCQPGFKDYIPENVVIMKQFGLRVQFFFRNDVLLHYGRDALSRRDRRINAPAAHQHLHSSFIGRRHYRVHHACGKYRQE
jgi:hypothetical protein